jgi:hypothetical protein
MKARASALWAAADEAVTLADVRQRTRQPEPYNNPPKATITKVLPGVSHIAPPGWPQKLWHLLGYSVQGAGPCPRAVEAQPSCPAACTVHFTEMPAAPG